MTHTSKTNKGFTHSLSFLIESLFTKKSALKNYSDKSPKINLVRGFTLLELLVVIAIIGILSTVIIVSLSNSRAKAKISSAQATVSTILPIAVTCLDEGETLNDMTDVETGGGLICDNNIPEWPALGEGWHYETPPISDTVASSFSFTVADDLGNSVTCTHSSGCTTTLAE